MPGRLFTTRMPRDLHSDWESKKAEFKRFEQNSSTDQFIVLLNMKIFLEIQHKFFHVKLHAGESKRIATTWRMLLSLHYYYLLVLYSGFNFNWEERRLYVCKGWFRAFLFGSWSGCFASFHSRLPELWVKDNCTGDMCSGKSYYHWIFSHY